MDNQEIQKQLDEQQQALVKIYKSVEKTRKMIFWSGVATAVTFILPLIIVLFMLPKIIGTFTSSMDAFSGVDSRLELNADDKKSLSDSLNALKELGL